MKKTITILLAVFLASGLNAQNALNFPDADDYGTVANDYLVDFAFPFTIESWVKASGTSYQTIASTDSVNASGHTGYWFGLTPGGVAGLQLFNGSFSFSTHSGTTNVNDDMWHHVAVSGDGTNIYFVIDGVQEGISAYTTPTPSGHTLDIGIDQEGNDLTGTLDDLRFWVRSITPAEINLYKDSCLTGMEDSLAALYRFDETAGSLFADSGPYGLNGTLTNMTDNDWVAGIVCQTIIPPAFSAIEFDGVDDYLEINSANASDLLFPGDFTFEAWVAPTVNSHSDFIFNTQTNLGGGFFVYENVNGKIGFTTSGTTILSSTAVLIEDSCNHVAVVKEGDSVYVYANSNLIFTAYTATINYQPDAVPQIGVNVDNAFFEGKMNQLRFWNAARSASDLILYADSSFVGSSDPTLVALYEFDGNSGQIVLLDQTASGAHNGILLNMDSSTVWVLEDNCEIFVSLDEHAQLDNVALYPNPTNGTVNLQLGEITNASIQVYSMDGQLVYNESNINTIEHTFNLVGMSGVYHVIVTAENARKHLKLIRL